MAEWTLPLAGFVVFDATSYEQIASIPVDKAVLDLAVEQTGSFLAVCCAEASDATQSMTRVYEIGRSRRVRAGGVVDEDATLSDEENDLEEASESDQDEEDNELGDDEFNALLAEAAPELLEEELLGADGDQEAEEARALGSSVLSMAA